MKKILLISVLGLIGCGEQFGVAGDVGGGGSDGADDSGSKPGVGGDVGVGGNVGVGGSETGGTASGGNETGGSASGGTAPDLLGPLPTGCSNTTPNICVGASVYNPDTMMAEPINVIYTKYYITCTSDISMEMMRFNGGNDLIRNCLDMGVVGSSESPNRDFCCTDNYQTH